MKDPFTREKEAFIQCACGSEGLHLYKFKEDDELYISVWEMGYSKDNRLTWKQRLRYIWRIIREGRPYGDQIVLNREGRSKLIHALVEAHLVNKIDSLSANGAGI
jgi:hypothetical protein